MLQKLLLALAVILSAGVLPTPSRPRTKRLSRADVWTDFRSLALDQTAITNAEQQLRDRKRMAVVSISSSDVAAVAAEIIRPAFRYSDQLIVVDATTSETLFDAASSADQIRREAEASDIDFVLWVEDDPGTRTISLRVLKRGGEGATTLSQIEYSDAEDAVLAEFVKARKAVLAKFDVMPTANLEQLERRPKASMAAIGQLIAARRMLATVAETGDAEQRGEICRAAIETINEAIAGSPNYLEAYLIKASCQNELNQEAECQETLKIAWGKKDPPQYDLLTLMELQGDHARIVRRDIDDAFDAYEDLLAVDPTSLAGLWAMIDILLEDDPNTEADLDGAADYAATLVTAHPHSAVAKAIMAEQEE